MENKNIFIATEFSEYPGLRHCDVSDDSGEEFYHKILNKAFQETYESKTTLTIHLDNTAGYAPSFLDEAFGNLIYDFSEEVVNKHLNIISIEEPSWIDMIKNQTFKQWEERRNKESKPKITSTHDDWYRIQDGILTLKQWK